MRIHVIVHERKEKGERRGVERLISVTFSRQAEDTSAAPDPAVDALTTDTLKAVFLTDISCGMNETLFQYAIC